MARHDTGLHARGVSVLSDDSLCDAQSLHSQRMQDHLREAIAAAGGWISFERYMDIALYAPGLGYYSAGSHKLGREGDFITAPEVSRLFGACVARQCAAVMEEIGSADILEIGAGTGRLAVDLLRRLDALGRLPRRYWILEISADLRERQREYIHQHLPTLANRIEWLDAPPDAPFDGVVLANEVLDALPVVRFRWHDPVCEELGVAYGAGHPVWEARTASPAVQCAVLRLAAAAPGWDDGYVSEYCPRLGAWARAVAQTLRRGVALWFDYGLPRAQYYLPERHEGTLICHFRHRTHDDPLRHCGFDDITAWVDFTALADAGRDSGFEVGGFTTQAFFLAGLGIDREMDRLAQGDAQRFAQLAQEAKQLLLPGGMGESFKVMAWTRGIGRDLSGFALQDLRHSL